MVCMGVVTAAIGAMMYAQFGYSLSASILAGGIAWCGFMLAHLQARKTEQIGKLKSDLAKLQAELAHSRGGEGRETVGAAVRALQAEGQRPAPRLQGRAKRQQARGPDNGGETAHASAPDADEFSAPIKLDPGARWETHAPQPGARLKPPSAPDARPAVTPAARNTQPPQPPAALDAALWPGTSVSGSDPMSDLWAFRPNASALPRQGEPGVTGIGNAERRGAQAVPPGLGEGAAEAASPGPVSTIDADLELVQRKIKALADEVNAAEAMKALVVPQDQAPAAASPLPGAMEQTIGALKSTARAMRERPLARPSAHPSAHVAEAKAAMATSVMPPPAPGPVTQGLPADLFIPTTAQTIAVSQPAADETHFASDRGFESGGTAPEIGANPGESAPDAGPVATGVAPQSEPQPFDPDAFERLVMATAPVPAAINPEVAALSHAVEQGRMDVYLTPIVGLDTYEVRHYEVTVRVKSESGTYLDNQDRTLELAGPGMLALFDAARLTRTSIVADRLDARGKTGSLLSKVTGASMTDGDFLETFARIYETRSTIANQLVLTFSQADVERLTPGAWQALGDMQAFGFRFALDRIEHLDMDFAGLAGRGFAFVKLPASALVEGVPSRDRFIEPHEACKQLAGAGLTLVAETIDDEALRARVFGFGVLLGQGQLFGGARHIGVDPVPGGNRSEAA